MGKEKRTPWNNFWASKKKKRGCISTVVSYIKLKKNCLREKIMEERYHHERSRSKKKKEGDQHQSKQEGIHFLSFVLFSFFCCLSFFSLTYPFFSSLCHTIFHLHLSYNYSLPVSLNGISPILLLLPFLQVSGLLFLPLPLPSLSYSEALTSPTLFWGLLWYHLWHYIRPRYPRRRSCWGRPGFTHSKPCNSGAGIDCYDSISG